MNIRSTLIISLLLINIGTVANLTVMYANDGRMPVVSPLYGWNGTVLDERHSTASDDSALLLFSDWIDIETVGVIVSLGDLLIWAGCALALVSIFVFLSIKIKNTR